MKLKVLRDAINSDYAGLYQAVGADEFINMFYPGLDPANENTFLNPQQLKLVIYLVAEQMGLTDESIIPDDLLNIESNQFVYIPKGNTATRPTAPIVASLAIDKTNTIFIKRLKNFLESDQENTSFIVSLSSADNINTSHFVEYSFAKKPGNIISFTIQDSVLGEHAFSDSLEVLWQSSVLQAIISQYKLDVAVKKVMSQNAADCLIHAVNNFLEAKLGKKNQLTPEKVKQVREGIRKTLLEGAVPESKVHNRADPIAAVAAEVVKKHLNSSQPPKSGREQTDLLIEQLKLDSTNQKHMKYWQMQVTLGGASYKGYTLPHTIVNALKFIEENKNKFGYEAFNDGLKQNLTQKSGSRSSFAGFSRFFRSNAIKNLREAASNDKLDNFNP